MVEEKVFLLHAFYWESGSVLFMTGCGFCEEPFPTGTKRWRWRIFCSGFTAVQRCFC